MPLKTRSHNVACLFNYFLTDFLLLTQDVKKVKMETFIDEDVPLSKRRKESPKSSQPSSPATRYLMSI